MIDYWGGEFMDILSVIIVDNPNICKEFINLADIMEDISIISSTNDANKAISDIKDFLPDAVILELELYLGNGNGFDILLGLQNLDLNIDLPYILITTNNMSPITYNCARQLGADFIISKHQNDYSEKYVLDFLRMVKPVIHTKKKKTFLQNMTESPESQRKRLTRRITTELNHIGISPKVIGYQYLLEAIIIAIDRPVHNLCIPIAQKYKKTESSVERAMQNAVKRAWQTTDIDMLSSHYVASVRSASGVPTITEFIYYYANKIKNEY